MTTQVPNQSVSRCNVCSCTIVRFHVPWSREWVCNGEHRRCTMIGCVPVLQTQSIQPETPARGIA